jgi:A nuclease family of the HNH/ENDO VII superfamily with conserved AHH
MPSFKTMRNRFRLAGFHCHHLIPLQLVEQQSFAILFGNLRAHGFDPHSFDTNGMHLPCTEKLAVAFALPLHRGAHPHYNQMVANHLARIAALSTDDALAQTRMLQKLLKQGLRRSDMLRPIGSPKMRATLRAVEEEANALHGLLTKALVQ